MEQLEAAGRRRDGVRSGAGRGENARVGCAARSVGRGAEGVGCGRRDGGRGAATFGALGAFGACFGQRPGHDDRALGTGFLGPLPVQARPG
ncbi:hypothetical protein [Streptomyces sp. NPDC001410]|uniref:hypothetical protein n=1 Tax=Streptomyces sp. NPDC001410 TaxID=3364574 RepID=UPI0036912990